MDRNAVVQWVRHGVSSVLLITVSLCFISPIFAGANTDASIDTSKTTVGRYLIVHNKPLAPQVNLLHQTVQRQFSSSIQTVGDAVRDLLAFSGYSLLDPLKMDSQVRAMLKAPLPIVERNFGPMSLEDGLATLAGNSFRIVVDPVHRLIGFELKPKLKNLYSNLHSKSYKYSNENHNNNCNKN